MLYRAVLAAACIQLLFFLFWYQKSKVSRKAHADPAEEFLKLYGQHPHSSEDYDSLRKTVIELRQENKDLKEDNDRWKEMVLQGIIHLVFINYSTTIYLFCYDWLMVLLMIDLQYCWFSPQEQWH